MTPRETVLKFLSTHPFTESELSKESHIPLKELRPLLGKLRDEELIDHIGDLIWLTSQGSERTNQANI